jgi:ribosomal subunit interface protein
MQVVVTGKQVNLGEALQRHVSERLTALAGKYFDNVIGAHAVFSREGPMFRAECGVRVGSGIEKQAKGDAADIYAAFEAAATRLEKQLRRDKRRRRMHHGGGGPDIKPVEA